MKNKLGRLQKELGLTVEGDRVLLHDLFDGLAGAATEKIISELVLGQEGNHVGCLLPVTEEGLFYEGFDCLEQALEDLAGLEFGQFLVFYFLA